MPIKLAMAKRATIESVSIFNGGHWKLRLYEWFVKINLYETEFRWPDRETVSRIGPFLLKYAKRWFTAWKPTHETWKIFKTNFSAVFP